MIRIKTWRKTADRTSKNLLLYGFTHLFRVEDGSGTAKIVVPVKTQDFVKLSFALVNQFANLMEFRRLGHLQQNVLVNLLNNGGGGWRGCLRGNMRQKTLHDTSSLYTK